MLCSSHKELNKNLLEDDQFKRIVLERLQFHLHRKFLFNVLDRIDIRLVPDSIAKVLAADIEFYFVGEKVDERQKIIRYPLDWWQSFKERFLPDWLKKKFPILYREIIVKIERKAVYPQLPHMLKRNEPYILCDYLESSSSNVLL